MQTLEHTAPARPPAPKLLVQPASHCTSSVVLSALCVDLTGWPEGWCTRADWLDAGGPIDATDHLPMGGAWSHQYLQAHVLGGSVPRAGALA